MKQSKIVKPKMKVLVVGASFSGLHLMHHLCHSSGSSFKSNQHDDSSLQITLVDPKDYFEYTPGILHALAGSQSYSQISGLLSTMHTDKCEILQGMFIGVQPCQRKAYFALRQPNNNDSNNNKISNNEEYISCLDYDALVICTGNPYTSPIRPCLVPPLRTSSLSSSNLNNNNSNHNHLTYAARKQEIQDFTQQLRSVDSVLIAGGGLVGVELAAEIVTRLRYNNNELNSKRSNGRKKKTRKLVTLITRSKALVDTLPSQAGKCVYEWLVAQGVKVILDDEIIDMKKDTDMITTAVNTSDSTTGESSTAVSVVTKSGHHISAGFYIDCTGRYRPPSSSQSTISSYAELSSSESSIISNNNNNSGDGITLSNGANSNTREEMFNSYLKENNLRLASTATNESTSIATAATESVLKSSAISIAATVAVSTSDSEKEEEGAVYAFPFTNSKSILVNQHFQALDFLPMNSNIFSFGDCATQSRSLALACSTAKDQNQYGVPHFPTQVRNANFAGYEAKICAYNVMTTLQQQQQRPSSVESSGINKGDSDESKSFINPTTNNDNNVICSLMKSYPEDVFGGTLISLIPLPSSSSLFSSSPLSASRSFYSNILAASQTTSATTITTAASISSSFIITNNNTTTSTRAISPVLLPLAACVSLGPHSAVLVLNNIVLGGMILGRIAAIVKFMIERSKVAEMKGQWWARAFWSVAQGILHVKNVIEHNIWMRKNKNKNNNQNSSSKATTTAARTASNNDDNVSFKPGFLKPAAAYLKN